MFLPHRGSRARLITGAQNVEYAVPTFIIARASRPIWRPVSAQRVRLKDMAVVMANLLPLTTSFEKRKLNLGYRMVKLLQPLPFAATGSVLSAHEFHYSTVVSQGKANPLFAAQDSRDNDIGACGMVQGSVAGSYMHLIDTR